MTPLHTPAARRIAAPKSPPAGRTCWLLRERDFGRTAPMDFGVLRLPAGSSQRLRGAEETVAVLLRGRARVTVAGRAVVVSRTSVFAHGPFTISVGNGERAEIESLAATEWVVMKTSESKAAGVRLYPPSDCAAEDRGAGLAQGTCRRLVRTIFDHSNRPDSAFVVGEVINLPGRWSSYPPHHHPQPEVYHYRFTEPQGYGHAEIGEDVHRVMSGDTTLIPGGLDHAQVSAPGYGMYYLWVVRHLPRRPYRGFSVTKEHRWLLDPSRQGWRPSPRLFS